MFRFIYLFNSYMTMYYRGHVRRGVLQVPSLKFKPCFFEISQGLCVAVRVLCTTCHYYTASSQFHTILLSFVAISLC